ncbi:MAG: hypothetical protein U0Q16_16130 [Bryobacteraceae bacterium]
MYYRQRTAAHHRLVANTQLLQIYFDRWRIEVNHREEKDTPGSRFEYQLWNLVAVPRQPAFAVMRLQYDAVVLSAGRPGEREVRPATF